MFNERIREREKKVSFFKLLIFSKTSLRFISSFNCYVLLQDKKVYEAKNIYASNFTFFNEYFLKFYIIVFKQVF
jgi:hypothetical protein